MPSVQAVFSVAGETPAATRTSFTRCSQAGVEGAVWAEALPVRAAAVTATEAQVATTTATEVAATRAGRLRMTRPSDGSANGGWVRHLAFHGPRRRRACQTNVSLVHLSEWRGGWLERVLGPGEGAALDVLVVGTGGAEQLAVEVGVLLDEGGHPAGAQAEGVLSRPAPGRRTRRRRRCRWSGSPAPW